MLSLTEELTQSVSYKGHEYPIDLAFDNVLRFYQLLDDTDFDEAEKIIAAFHIFFDESIPEDPEFLMNVVKLLGEYVSASPYGNDVRIVIVLKYRLDISALHKTHQRSTHRLWSSTGLI